MAHAAFDQEGLVHHTHQGRDFKLGLPAGGVHARRIYADAVVFTDDTLAMAVNVFGSGNVLYGSDYLHTIGDPIGCLARVDRLPAGVRERVRGLNSEKIFPFR